MNCLRDAGVLEQQKKGHRYWKLQVVLSRFAKKWFHRNFLALIDSRDSDIEAKVDD